jgi:cellulose biosynthesis protein BcsQ
MILTIASFKGGVGKTTTAVNLAAYLNEKQPTLLIDGDPNHRAGRAGRGCPSRLWTSARLRGFRAISSIS